MSSFDWNSTSSAIDSTYKRSRPGGNNIACGRCRKLHIKCDGEKPRCSACKKKDAVCEWVPPPPKSRPLGNDAHKKSQSNNQIQSIPDQTLGGEDRSPTATDSIQQDEPFLKTPMEQISPRQLDAELHDIPSLAAFRSCFIEHCHPICIRTPLSADEVRNSNSLAEMAFFYVAIGIGCRGLGRLAHGEVLVRKGQELLVNAEEFQCTDEAILSAYLGMLYFLKTVSNAAAVQQTHANAQLALQRIHAARMTRPMQPDEHDLRLFESLQNQHVADANTDPEHLLACFQHSHSLLVQAANSFDQKSRTLADLLSPTCEVPLFMVKALQDPISLGPAALDELQQIFAKINHLYEVSGSLKTRYQLINISSLCSLHSILGDAPNALSCAAEALHTFTQLSPAYYDGFCIPSIFLALQIMMRLDFRRYRAHLDFLRTRCCQYGAVVLNCISRLQELEEDLELIQSIAQSSKLIPPRLGWCADIELPRFLKRSH